MVLVDRAVVINACGQIAEVGGWDGLACGGLEVEYIDRLIRVRDDPRFLPLDREKRARRQETAGTRAVQQIWT